MSLRSSGFIRITKMPLAIFIIAVLIVAAGLLDFLIGIPGEQRLKRALLNFYISVAEGDWNCTV